MLDSIDPQAIARVAGMLPPERTLSLAIGGEVLRWEIAVALTGAALGINPFDQPDAEAAKQAARQALDEGVSEPDVAPIAPLLAQPGVGDHLVLPRRRSALPALHGSAPQGRAEHRRVPPGCRR